MNLKEMLLKEDEFEEQMDEDLLTSLGEFVDLLDEELITDEIENDIVDIFDKYYDLLEKLNIDTLPDDVVEHLKYVLDLMGEDIEELDEVVKKKMIRKGKMIKRLPPKKGYKVKGNRYVRMKPKESKTRSRSAKRGARKARAKTASRNRQMKKSLRKRAGRGLK